MKQEQVIDKYNIKLDANIKAPCRKMVKCDYKSKLGSENCTQPVFRKLTLNLKP